MNYAAVIANGIQILGIPVLAIALILIVINAMKNDGSTTAKDESNFVMKESYFWITITILGLAIAAIFMWQVSVSISEVNQGLGIALAICCALGAVVSGYVYFKHSLEVTDENYTIHPLKGKTESFPVKTIGKVEIIKTHRCETYRFYNRNGKKLFEVQGYMTNVKLLKRFLKKHPVKIVRKDLEAVNK